MNQPINLFDYEVLARQNLPSIVWDYYSSGLLDFQKQIDPSVTWKEMEWLKLITCLSRGPDIFKTLAVGAKALLVGRPILWGVIYYPSVSLV
jgi:hypothetical protein